MSNEKQNYMAIWNSQGLRLASLSKGEVVNNISDDWIPFRRQK